MNRHLGLQTFHNEEDEEESNEEIENKSSDESSDEEDVHSVGSDADL